MPTHQAFHLKRLYGGKKELCLVHPEQFYLSPINSNCGPVTYILNAISPSSLQIAVPRNKVISFSEPAPAHLGQAGPRPQPSISQVWPTHISPGARTTKLWAVIWAVEMLIAKAANIFHAGFSFVMLKKKMR